MPERRRLPVPEAGFQSAVIDLARLRGWHVMHARPARTAKGWRTPIQGDVGYPDLTLARLGWVIFAELKSSSGRLTEAQAGWLRALTSPRTRAEVWRPVDWPHIEEVLR